MGLIEIVLDRETIKQKTNRLIDIAIDEGEDMLIEALSLIHPVFGEADCTIFNFKKAELLVSTVYNEDILDAVRTELSSIVEYEEIEGFRKYDKKKLRRLRPGVMQLGIVPLFTKKNKELVLAVEYYSKYDGIALEKLDELFKVLTLVTRNAYLAGIGQNALRIDGSTMLPNRDALVERLSSSINMGVKQCCLGIISLANAQHLTEKLGGAETDRLLRSVGMELGKMMPGSVYRVGGTKFGIVISGDIYYARPILEGLIDRILMLNENLTNEQIITANVLAPLSEDAYATIAICEKNLKYTDEDVVTIVRGMAAEAFEAEYRDVCDTFLDAAYKEVPAEEGGTRMYERDDASADAHVKDAVVDKEETDGQQPRGATDYVMNDVFDFARWQK